MSFGTHYIKHLKIKKKAGLHWTQTTSRQSTSIYLHVLPFLDATHSFAAICNIFCACALFVPLKPDVV